MVEGKRGGEEGRERKGLQDGRRKDCCDAEHAVCKGEKGGFSGTRHSEGMEEIRML